MARKLLDDCFVADKPRLRHAEAIAILKSGIGPMAEPEVVGLSEAAGRILAEAATAPLPVPAHTNAAVDGYSFAAADYDREGGASCRSRGGRRLGMRWARRLERGAAVRIFTGAVMPTGHDTVVMQEDVRPFARSANMRSSPCQPD